MPPAAMLAPAVQVLAVIAKSPLIAVLLMTSDAVPELVSVVTCVAAVAPTLVEAKLSVEGATDAPGAVAVVQILGAAMNAPRSLSWAVESGDNALISVTLAIPNEIPLPVLAAGLFAPFFILLLLVATLGP